MMVFSLISVDHFDGFMHSRIERLPHRLNRPNAHFLERVLELAIDELQTAAKIVGIARRSLQCAFEAVEDWQNILDDIRGSEFAKLLLFAGRAFAGIVEFRLQPGQTVEQRVPFGTKLVGLRYRAPVRDRGWIRRLSR